MMSTAESAARLEGREMIVSRLIQAPRDLVWKAFTDPAHLAHWWGPLGFTTTTHAFDLRVGGEWRNTMHGPEGTDYPNRLRFREVVEGERVVYDHDDGNDESPEAFRTTLSFTDLGGATHVVLRAAFLSAEACRLVAEKYGALEGGTQTLARLADEAAVLGTEGVFTVRRTLDAPRERVWRAWTEGAELAQWWGPKGMALEVLDLDLRPGGRFHYAMTAPDGHRMYGRFRFRDLAAPSRLVYLVAFADEAGELARHPLAPAWPAEMLNVLTLDEEEGRTVLTLRVVAHEASEGERRAFEAGFASMTQGFSGTLDHLAAHLAARP